MSSVFDFCYYIIIVDDYSRVSWVYLFKDGSHVPTIIKKNFNKIKIQFSATTCFFRTDNALEFMQSNISEFCASHGILHQTSCPHTSQQNRVAERKHRHILNVTRTLMVQMHVPKCY